MYTQYDNFQFFGTWLAGCLLSASIIIVLYYLFRRNIAAYIMKAAVEVLQIMDDDRKERIANLLEKLPPDHADKIMEIFNSMRESSDTKTEGKNAQ